MTRPNRSKNTGRMIGKGEVTPIQVAFLVDRYLCDNRFLKTRSVFRSEASSLISNSPVRDVPNSLIPLDEILNEYIRLKKEKVILDQEKSKLDQEKTRVQNLLHGMQDVMNVYNSTAIPPALPPPPPPPPAIPAPAPTNIQLVASSSKQNNVGVSPSGCTVYKAPNVMAVSLPGNKRVGNFTGPSSIQSITKKRKTPEASSLGAPSVSKKGMKTIRQADKVTNYLTFESSSAEIQTTPVNSNVANESSDLTPKCLFNKSDMSPPSNSAFLRTPQKQVSPQSDDDTSVTPHQEVTPPTNCTIVTTERITVSPLKQIASYTVERSHTVSSFSPVKSDLKMSSKRDHVKGRLNFDDTDTTMHLDAPATTADLVSASSSGSEAEADLFDIDFSSMELLSEDFPFADLLNDFDLGCEGMPDSCLPQPSNSFIETASGSAPESTNANPLPDQVVSEYRSTVTETIQEKDMNTQGSDSMTTVKSITKCLRILSPAKKCRQSHRVD